MQLLEELKWRGLLDGVLTDTEEQLNKEKQKVYIGFDPTAGSLTIGNLLPVILLTHIQKAGHQPVALVGGATGMVGDPSGKSSERPVLDTATLLENAAKIEKQLRHFLDFENETNPALMRNNLDWFKEMNLLQFLRDAGKHITVNYMMSKESVKNRMEQGISFTEFSYQLLQGYDFYHLYKTENCKIQAGGSDQWGNITTGSEFVRRKLGQQAYGFTCPLLTHEDGTKFGKSEGKNLWLDPSMTSPYNFYQFWINCSDKDASRFIRIFTFLNRETIENLESEHNQAPHQRILQKKLAEEVTTWVHGKEEFQKAIEATEVLFGKGTVGKLYDMDESLLLSALEGVEQYAVPIQKIQSPIDVLTFLTELAPVFASKGEIRRLIKSGGLKVNKETVATAEATVDLSMAIKEKYFLVQKGRKSYYLVYAEA